MSKYIEKLEKFLLSNTVKNVEKVTINDDNSPTGSKIKENDNIDVKDQDSLELSSTGRMIGYKPKKSVKLKAKKIEDNRTSGKSNDEFVYVYNKKEGLLIKRKIK